MSNQYRPVIASIITLIVLLPLFFIPGGAIDFLNAKAFLIALVAVVAGGAFLYRMWRERQMMLPKHYILVAAAFLPVVYLLSALLATPSSLSLLGYNLEAGTFGSVLIGVILLTLVAAVFSDPARSLQAVLALFGSLSVLSLFATVKILSGGNWFVWGNFSGNMGNPLGAWTDLGMAMGILAVISVLAIGMLPMKGVFRVMAYAVMVLSTVLLAIIHFRSAFVLTLVASVLMVIYFVKIEERFHGAKAEGKKSFSRKAILPAVLGLISLIFLINPIVSAEKGALGQVVSGAFGVSNSEVHPTLSTTLSVSKAVLAQNVLLGSGPNTFTQDWLVFKPADINATPFWAVEFPFGAGFFATQIAATGIVGTLAWLAFLALLLILTLRVVTNIPESRAARFALVSTLTTTLFLWAAAFVYTPSAAVLMLSFVFTGLLLATAGATGIIPTYVISFKETTARFMSNVAILLAVVGLATLLWAELGRVVASYHFERAVALSNTEGAALNDVETELGKAVTYAPLDTYFLALSNLNFSKAQVIASSATGTPEEIQPVFENAVAQSIAAARAAVNANPASYGNWVALGSLYSSLVAKPLEVDGAYENAQFAYNEAFKRNPSNPSLPLLLAQLEINKENYDNARSYVRSSLALKDDYADAYLLLARLEASQNNLPAAIASAEKLATLAPDNAGLFFEIGVLKYTAEDYAGAKVSLEKALSLSADYANAKYYLALTLTKLGDADTARTLLEDLQKGNPESAELQAALEALNKPATQKK